MRDHFAATALAGLLAGLSRDNDLESISEMAQDIADTAWDLADAMVDEVEEDDE